MVRAAAKNHAARRGRGRPGRLRARAGGDARARAACREATRFALAREGVRAHRGLRRRDRQLPHRARRARQARATSRSRSTCSSARSQDLRYGENPHQSAAFYRDRAAACRAASRSYRQLQGKELSYNNIADADAAWECVKSFDEPACVIVKHANPCGVAVGATPLEAYGKAFATDPTSAFGGIIAFNRALDARDRRGGRASSSSRW